jgi:hypothetical protein
VNVQVGRLVLPIMRNRLTLGVIRLAALAAVLTCAGCDVKVGDSGMSFDVTHGRANDEWVRSYTIQKGGTLEIVAAGGPVSVPAGGPAVQVKLVRQGQASTDEAAAAVLKEETIAEDVSPERVRVETKRSGRNTASFGRRRVSTEWHVAIPAGLNVSIKGENADISLTAVDGHFTLENTNGGFRSEGLSGSVNATTVNGVIGLEFAALTGDVTVTTVNGPVRIALPQNAKATVDASTVNGEVSIDEALVFTPAVRERLKLAGDVNGGGGPKLALRTTNGSVRIGVAGRRSGRGGPNRGEPVVIERERRER